MADYIPRQLAELAVWIKNFEDKLTGVLATKYGVGAAAMTALGLDVAWVEYWAGAKASVKDDGETVNSFVENTVNGDLGGPTGTNPSVGLPAGTPAARPPGLKKRIREIVNGIKAQKSIYVEADGEALGFEGGGAPPDPATVKPTLKIFPALLGNFEAAAVVEGRALATQAVIEARPLGSSASWTLLATVTKKTADIEWAAGTDAPVQLEFRARLLKGDDNYGQPSDIVIATLNP